MQIFLRNTILIMLYFGLVFMPAKVFAQEKKDDKVNIPFTSLSYGLQFPQKTLAERFGINSNVGTQFSVKTKFNLILGLEAEYLFGSNLKEDSILDDLMAENGEILNEYGEYSNYVLSERGYYFAFKIGGVIPVFSPNRNSGILVSTSVGFIEHHIRIDNEGNNTPQILGEYKKGYDRLTNGLVIKEFVGYQYIGDNQFLNFYAGLEFYQSWTQNRRTFNFDTMEQDTRQRNDNLIGFRVGWIIPLYRHVPDTYFEY